MPISTPTAPDPSSGPGRRAERGFTLVELMVVVFIVGLMAGTVVLTLPGGEAKLSRDAELFALRAAAARDDSILQSRPVGLWVSRSGYGFEERRGGEWRRLDTKDLALTDWSAGTVAVTGGEEGQARLRFDSTGLPTGPLDLLLLRDGKRSRIRIDAAGEVRLGE